MLFSDDWKNTEDSISDKIIKDTFDIINFNKNNLQNQLCIKYISICDYDKTERYIIFVPFTEYSEIYYENNFPYLFIKLYKISVSDDFMKWLFYTSRANKIPVIIGKIDQQLSGAWNICHGDKNLTWNCLDEIELINFERWLYEKSLINPNFKIYIRNPIISKVPFPLTEQNFEIIFNKKI